MLRTGCRLIRLLVLLMAGVTGAAAAPTVLFDQGHGQRFVIESDRALDLSQLAEEFRSAGYQVRASGAPLSPELLQGIQVLVLSGPFAPYSDAEIASLTAFLRAGGRVLLSLHVGPLNGPLLKHLGAAVSMGIVRQPERQLDGKSNDFEARTLALHPLTRGLDGIRFYGTWALRNDDPRLDVVVSSDANAWVDLNRNQRRDAGEPTSSFALILAGDLGSGRLFISGDDAIFQNQFLTGSNLQLARNLIRWFAEPDGPRGSLVIR